ncbi:Splicing factor 1 [Orchesella cincta]|uniref:Branchpoint-bridging protein n=1 Tax=Orchesella cincta TaxID=48709 RepID=A0A1D2NBJ4_ORCCI|nr:Splicing factor 1 [Orchesella cincta]
MSRNYRDDPNKVPLGDRRPWPTSHSSSGGGGDGGMSSVGAGGVGGSLLNPSYLSGGRESPLAGGAGNNSFASIPSKFSQEFQSRWSSLSEYGEAPSVQVARIGAFDVGNSLKRNQPGMEILNHFSDSNSNSQEASEGDSREKRRKKRRSRWMGTENEKAVIPGMPTILPADLTPDQTEAYIAQLQIEELTRKLRTGDLGIPTNPEERSPSPEPIYGTDGKRLNTREYRTRKKLEEERHKLIQKLMKINPDYKPPADYRAPMVKIVDRVPIPQEEHPEINFVGLLIGPRGNTLKGLEKDSGAKIIIRGKGSVKEGKVGGKAGGGHPLPGEDEPLHAYVTSNNPESVKKACEKIKEIIRQGIEMPESQNDLRKMQLRELALLNGTLREGEGPKCSNCGATSHRTWHCPDKPNITNSVVCTVCGAAGHISKDCKAKRPGEGGPPGSGGGGGGNKAKIDEEYLSLMAELGEAEPPKHEHESGSRFKSGPSRLFDSKGPMKALPAPSPASSASSAGSSSSNNPHQVLRNPPPPPPTTTSSNNDSAQSRYAPPPPPMVPPAMSQWGNVPPPGVSSQPPPPGNQPPPPGSDQQSPPAAASHQWGGYYPPPPMPPYNQWGAPSGGHPPPQMFWQNYAPPPHPLLLHHKLQELEPFQSHHHHRLLQVVVHNNNNNY